MPRWSKLALLLLPLTALLLVSANTLFPNLDFPSLPVHRLSGVLRAVPSTELSPSSFWQGTFQSTEEKYFEAKLAFKPILVRSENTLNLVVFHEISAHTGIPVILGKQDTLFEMNYIDNLNAVCDEKDDPPPAAPGSVAATTQRMGQAARAFAALDIDFVLVLYPSKAWLYPDRVPQRFRLLGGQQSAQAGFSELLAELRGNGVSVVDGVDALTVLRQQNPSLPLFNRGGTHWTDAAACSVAQRIVAALPKERESPTGNPSGLACTLGPSAIAAKTDVDIALLSNIWDIARFQDQIPSVAATLTRPLVGGARSTLVVGTSFSEHLVRLLTRARAIKNVNYIDDYRHVNASHVKWERELNTRQLVIFEQWQASRLTVNLMEFLDDLEQNAPRFRQAMQLAEQQH